MKIISDFRDYYDHAIKYNVDDDIVYNRFSKVVPFGCSKSDIYPISWNSPYRDIFVNDSRSNGSNVSRDYISYTSYSFVLSICSEIISGVRISYSTYDTSHIEYAYSTSQIDSIFKSNKHLYKLQNEQVVNGHSRRITHNLYDTFDIKKPINSSFETFIKSKHVEYNSPIILIDGRCDLSQIAANYKDADESVYNFIVNPILRDLQLYKIRDQVSLYQDIRHYVGGVLNQPENSMISISNKDMAIKKGFGHKYAFRNEPKGK